MYAYVNNELLTENNPAYKEFADWCKNEWTKLPDNVIFKNGKQVRRDPYHGKPEIPNFIHYQLTSSVQTSSGLQTWHLCRDYAIKNEKTGRLKFPDDRWPFDISKTVQKDDKELLFFLINKFQPVLKKEIFVENKEKEALTEVQKEAIKGEVSFLINNKKSPLTETNIRFIAMSWNIADTNIMSLPEVKLALHRTIENKELKTKDGYSKFLSQIDNLDNRETYVSSLVRESIDKKVILFNGSKSQIEWNENLPDNQKVIYSLLPNELNNWFEFFVSFLTMNNKLVETIESSLGKNNKPAKEVNESKPIEITNQGTQLVLQNKTTNAIPKKRNVQKGHKKHRKVVKQQPKVVEKRPEVV